MEIERVAVVGAGTMGHGIAQVCAMAGAETRLWDADSAQLERAFERIAKNLATGVARGKVTEEVSQSAGRALRLCAELEEAVEATDLVIEAIPESLDLKRSLFAELDRVGPVGAILGSNTSSISISAIAEAVREPERVVGMHFFNPVHLMRLLEIVRGRHTSEETIERTARFARRIGKEPIVVADTPGFASSRLGIVLGLEAMRMVEQEVAAPESIDAAMVLGYNHPIGPLRLTDLVGLDIRLEIARYLFESLGGEQYRPPAILERMVAEGRLGRKSGHGFYTWEEA
jgi:3-hydroxybutyryl-CoA dehydrogenase